MKYPFFFLQKNADVSIFVKFQDYLSEKCVATPVFFVNPNSPCKDLLFPRSPNRAQKRLHLAGTVLKAGVHVKAVLTWLNTAFQGFLPISRSRFKQR